MDLVEANKQIGDTQTWYMSSYGMSDKVFFENQLSI